MSWFLEGRKRKDANFQEYIKASFASRDLPRFFVGATLTTVTTAASPPGVLLPQRTSSSALDLPFSQS